MPVPREARLVAIIFTLLCAACERTDHQASQSSVTVKLPPPRPAVPEPGFSALADRPGAVRPAT